MAIFRRRARQIGDLGSTDPEVRLFNRYLAGIAYALCIVIVLVLVIYTLQPGHRNWSVFAIALLVAGAGTAVGALLGFLFGIPKTLQDTAAQAANGEHYGSNSNLEQISDWLTKIIVGVGLTQLLKVPAAFGKLSDVLSGPLGGTPFGGTLGVCLAIFCSVVGFLLMYMWTRTLFLDILQRTARRRAGVGALPDAAQPAAQQPPNS